MVYAGFEGGVSISQKNLEQARSKFLLDKLTGKLPTDMKGGFASQLPPLTTDREKKISRSKASHLSASSKSRLDDSEIKPSENKKDKTGAQQP